MYSTSVKQSITCKRETVIRLIVYLYSTVMTNNVTGYGPSNSRLIFDGDERRYELWEVKFLGYLRLKKLSETILTPLADDASQQVIAADSVKNMDAFAVLIQFLDDRSLSLVIRDAANDGRKALGILREHYLSKGKPRVISLYTELTSLKKSADEDITDYMLRAETSATSLKSAGEQVSDSLLIAMIIKGLFSAEYKPFSTVVKQKDKELSFSEFKVSLRSFEETQKLSTESAKEDSVMKVNTGKPSYKSKKDLIFYGCGKAGHKKSECRVKKRWCDTCKNQTHDTEKCRKKKQGDDATKAVRDTSIDNNSVHEENHSFVFQVGVDVTNIDNVNGCLWTVGPPPILCMVLVSLSVLINSLILSIIILSWRMVVGLIMLR